jgi:hypothetical protein
MGRLGINANIERLLWAIGAGCVGFVTALATVRSEVNALRTDVAQLRRVQAAQVSVLASIAQQVGVQDDFIKAMSPALTQSSGGSVAPDSAASR